MNCSKVICDEIYKKSESTKWAKLAFLKKDRIFLTKRKGAQKMLFLSICFPPNGLSFEILPASSSHSQSETIKKQGESTRKLISVCNYVFELNEYKKNGKKRQKRYDLKERLKLHKMDYLWYFLSFF